jgi:hypothetical protein
MYQFFLHKKFWLSVILLITLILTAECFLRAGYYDDLLSKNSLIKRSLHRNEAIQQFGHNNINWITLGDSRTDWGLDHQRIQQLRQKNGLNHIRLSFGRSGFPAYQALTNWSLDNLPNLQGVLMGMPMSNFDQNPQIYNQKIIVWPFMNYFPEGYINKRDISKWFPVLNLFNNTYLSEYLPDIKDLLKNFSVRSEQFKSQEPITTQLLFESNFHQIRNVCKYKIDNLASCKQTAQKLIKRKNNNKTDKNIIKRCHKDAKKMQLNKHQITAAVERWERLFLRYLDNGISVNMVLYPQHPIFDYLFNPEGVEEINHQVQERLADEPNFETIDLRHVFKDNDIAFCSVYTDMLHFNEKGRKYVNNALIKHLQ